ncbi:hypothetical protein LCGC14_3070800, partial [marine sediment metagenome]
MAMTGMDIYKILPKTNCRDCGLRTCMSFASALLRGEKSLSDCPHLSDEARDELAPHLENISPEEGFREMINSLKAEVRELDLSAMARGLGARYSDGRLHITCLGKDFIINIITGIREKVFGENGLIAKFKEFVRNTLDTVEELKEDFIQAGKDLIG